MDGYYVIGNEFTKWEEFEVTSGVLNGDYITFHPNGNFSSFSKYQKGVLHGYEKYFYPSGKLQKEISYINGKRVGDVKTFYESGQVLTKVKYENGKMLESTTFDLIGAIKSQTFIKNGRTITQIINSGRIIREEISSNYDDFEGVKLYNKDGDLEYYLRITTQNEIPFIIELDSMENEIKKVNIQENHTEAQKYLRLLGLIDD